MSFSVVIPSKNDDNLDECVDSIRAAGETCRVIVIDDGLTRQRDDCDYFYGVKPFVFARNANLGISQAREDVILMNDDATLLSQGGFTRMVYERPARYALVSAAIQENVGNLSQLPKGTGGIRSESRPIAFVCVLIPWQIFNHFGSLDEDFTAYGSDDSDYCIRTAGTGLEIGIFDPCVVGHSGISTFRTMENNREMMMEGRKILQRKHGAPAL